MAAWLKDNSCIYNKIMYSYHQTDMKRLWIEKAEEFANIVVKYLMNWYKSMRTCFGKLSRLPTGSGTQEMTQKDEGIRRKFGCLKTHINRQRGKQLRGLTEKLSTAAGPSTSGMLSSGEDSDGDTCDVTLAIQEDYTSSDVCHPQSCLPEVQSAPTSTTSSASKSKVKSSDSILKECVVESRRLQDKVDTLLFEQYTSHDSQVQFALFFTSMIPRSSSCIIQIHIINSHSSIYLQPTQLYLQTSHQDQQNPVGQSYPPPQQ